MTPSHEQLWDHVKLLIKDQPMPWDSADHMCKEIMYQWHQSARTWRLNKEGCDLLKQLFTSYVYDTPDTEQIWINQPRVLLGLARHMKSPYHVDHRCLTVFDNQVALEIEVCDRDLDLWSKSCWN